VFYGALNVHVSLCISWALPVVQSVYRYVIRALRYLAVFTKCEYLQSKDSDFFMDCLTLEDGTNILLSITNKMQHYTIFFIIVNAVHVSGGFSAHHQELKESLHRQNILHFPQM